MQQKLKLFVTLLLLCLSTTAGAYNLTLNDNYDGGMIYNAGDVVYFVLPSRSRAGHTFLGWSESSTGPVEHAAGVMFALTKDLTLYAVWDHGLSYTITSESHKTVELMGYDGNKPTGVLKIPASVMLSGNVYAVTSIGDNAFENCYGLTSVDIPASVTSIGDNAFLDCDGLTSIEIPASVTSIGIDAFKDCSNLTTVTLNSNPFIYPAVFPAGATVTMNLTGHEGETGEYWMTFYNMCYNFQVPDGTQIFKAALSGTKITLTELTADKIVTENNPVILKSTTGPISLTLTATGGGNDFSGNSLYGVGNAEGKTATDPSKMFVLSKGANGVGFYRLAPGKRLGHGKAYFWYDGALSSNFLGFEDDETTGQNDVRCKMSEVRGDVFFDLSGRKVENPKKGIYIYNGRKEVLK